jgi:hypothetical protein
MYQLCLSNSISVANVATLRVAAPIQENIPDVECPVASHTAKSMRGSGEDFKDAVQYSSWIEEASDYREMLSRCNILLRKQPEGDLQYG